MSFRIPAFKFMNPRRSFHRLRSFHLTPAQATEQLNAITATPSSTENTKASSHPRSEETRASSGFTKRLMPGNLVIPLRGSAIVLLATLASLFFIFSISFAFVGADADEPYFMRTLNNVSESSPGLVLVGESVDVDIDEPSITIRWSLVACGEDLLLPGSAGILGSKSCGLPLNPLNIYVDGEEAPTATYDPSQIPFNKDTGHRRNIQNLVRFDSDHVLDVHEARLYPFDTYLLSSTLRAASLTNDTLPISRVLTLGLTSSFDILTTDLESFTTSANGTQFASCDIDMRVSRPGTARLFALLLFAVSWLLAHITIGHVVVARRQHGVKPLLFHLVSSGAILIAIPQIRQSMPDAPGLDGVLIDCIGFFPQMIVVGVCVIVLLLILVVREFDILRQGPPLPSRHRPSSILSRFPRPPPLPNIDSSSVDLAHWEMHRLMKHLQGQYVFPPVQPSHRLQPSDSAKRSHRRVKTMSRIMEDGEVSHWSDND